MAKYKVPRVTKGIPKESSIRIKERTDNMYRLPSFWLPFGRTRGKVPGEEYGPGLIFVYGNVYGQSGRPVFTDRSVEKGIIEGTPLRTCLWNLETKGNWLFEFTVLLSRQSTLWERCESKSGRSTTSRIPSQPTPLLFPRSRRDFDWNPVKKDTVRSSWWLYENYKVQRVTNRVFFSHHHHS